MIQEMIFDNVLSQVSNSNVRLFDQKNKFTKLKDEKMKINVRKLKDDHIKIENKNNFQSTPLGDYYFIEAKINLTNEMMGISYWKTGMFIVLKSDCVRNKQFDEELVKAFIGRVYSDYAIRINEIDIKKAYPVQPKNLADIPFKQIKITSSTIEHINGQPEQAFDDNLCALRYIYNTVVNQTYFKHISFEDLKQQFINLRIQISDGVSVNDIIKWIKAYYLNIFSLYAIDPFYKCFSSY
jgi:hypothetical protein